MPFDATEGGSAANSYGSLAAIKARWDDIGYDYSDPSYTDAVIQSAAIRATEWLEGTYRSRFPGSPELDTQSLHFPALDAYDVYGREVLGIPVAVFHAQCEATYRELLTPNSLTPDIVLGDSNARAVKRRKVGPGGVEREFERVAAHELKPTITAVEGLLSVLISLGGATKTLLRA